MTGDRNAAIDRFVAAAMAAAHEGRHPSMASKRRLYAGLAVARDPFVDPDDDEDDDQDQAQAQARADWPPRAPAPP